MIQWWGGAVAASMPLWYCSLVDFDFGAAIIVIAYLTYGTVQMMELKYSEIDSCQVGDYHNGQE